jgi:hypothetical protein
MTPRGGDPVDEGCTDQFDDLLIEEIRLACERAHTLAESDRGVPVREVPALRRTSRGLEAITREEIAWKILLVLLGAGFWPCAAEVVDALAADPAVEADIGWARGEQRAVALWNGVVAPTFERYGRRQPGFAWVPELARDLVAEWRAFHSPNPVPYRTIAPLHNLRGVPQPVVIGADTVIRAMTDEDRDELWRDFGGGVSSIPGLTPGQLDAWTDVIDTRWKMDRRPPLSDVVVIERIANVVTALRLHHPGVTGTTILWTRLDPPDAPAATPLAGATLYAPHGDPTFMHPLRANVGSDDGPALSALIDRLAAARNNRRVAMALRRFDSAYARRNSEDALIDLWVAFEALLVPDSTTELRYRASLRIARLVGQTATERHEAFEVARSSYDARSKVVHGAQPPEDVDKVVEDTRQLARVVLRAWVLGPPPGDVSDLDRAALD